MANESLVIQQNDARMTVIGKSWPDTSTDSGDGPWDDTYDGTYDGDIPRLDLPDRLEILVPPDKITFVDGEPITVRDLTGLEVIAYNEDGTISEWPVNNWEIWTDPIIAHYDDAMIGFRDLNYVRISGWTQYAYLFSSFCYFNTNVQLGTWYDSGIPTYAGSHGDYSSDILLTRYRGADGVMRFYAIAYPNAVGSFCICAPVSGESGIYGNYPDVGTRWTMLASWESPDFENVPISEADPRTAEEMRLNAVAIKWRRPNDGEILTATYEIEVTQQDGG